VFGTPLKLRCRAATSPLDDISKWGKRRPILGSRSSPTALWCVRLPVGDIRHWTKFIAGLPRTCAEKKYLTPSKGLPSLSTHLRIHFENGRGTA
jgi:hypothetical protein